jgi:hypothetical protein
MQRLPGQAALAEEIAGSQKRKRTDVICRIIAQSAKVSATYGNIPTDYRNRRPDYLKVFLNHLVNWDYVAERDEAAISSRGHRMRASRRI